MFRAHADASVAERARTSSIPCRASMRRAPRPRAARSAPGRRGSCRWPCVRPAPTRISSERETVQPAAADDDEGRRLGGLTSASAGSSTVSSRVVGQIATTIRLSTFFPPQATSAVSWASSRSAAYFAAANAAADSGEPSTPTTTRFGNPSRRGRTTSTEQGALWISSVATDPSTMPRSRPPSLVPTATSVSWSRTISRSSCGAGAPRTSSSRRPRTGRSACLPRGAPLRRVLPGSRHRGSTRNARSGGGDDRRRAVPGGEGGSAVRRRRGGPPLGARPPVPQSNRRSRRGCA